MKQPLVTIVIPCYNHAEYVKECISSVVAQDYKNIELLIIDDGSADESVEKIKELLSVCNERFSRFEFRTRANRGLCETLNESIAWANGDFYAAVASDDILKPYKISLQVKYLLKNLSCVGVFGGVDIITSRGELIRSVITRPKSYNFKDVFFHRHRLPAPTQMIRFSALCETGGYPAGLVIEDYYMWLKLTANGGTLDKLNISLASYRRHAGNMSARLGSMESGRYAILDLFEVEPDYIRAKSNAMLMAAIDLQPHNRKESLMRFKMAVKIYPRVCLQFKVVKFFLKMLLPASTLSSYFGGGK